MADGGGPLLLLFSVPLFTFGQVWIIGSEWFFLRKRLGVPPANTFGWILGANVISTIVCAIGLPLVWAILTIGVSSLAGDSELGKLVLASGTWILGDNSPYPNVALAATAIGFFVTFFPTWWVEWMLIRRWTSRSGNLPSDLVRTVFFANLISYLGLIALVAFFTFIDKVTNPPGI